MRAAGKKAVVWHRWSLQRVVLLLFAFIARGTRGADGCAVSRLLNCGQTKQVVTRGLLFEGLSLGAIIQKGSPGSGSSGWRLVDSTPLCPLLTTALPITPPECANISKFEDSKQHEEQRECEATGLEQEAGSCTWQGSSDMASVLASEHALLPLRSAIILPAPLDPILRTALSAREKVESPHQPVDDNHDEEEKPAYYGLWFHHATQAIKTQYERNVDIRMTQYEGSADSCVSRAVLGSWVVEQVSRELQGLGAHRQLLTRVVLEPGANRTGEGGVESVALMEALPTGVYADKFELKRLSSDGVASVASIFGPVDIERPASECTQSLAVAYAGPVALPGGRFEAHFVLPLHSRYPAVAPKAQRGPEAPSVPQYTVVEIGPPVYVLWTASQGLASEENLRMHGEWRVATWQERLDEDTVIRWDVPNGRAEHMRLVRAGTVSVCLAGTAYLLLTIAAKRRAQRSLS